MVRWLVTLTPFGLAGLCVIGMTALLDWCAALAAVVLYLLPNSLRDSFLNFLPSSIT